MLVAFGAQRPDEAAQGYRRLTVELLERREVLSALPLATASAADANNPDPFEPDNSPITAAPLTVTAGAQTAVAAAISAPGPGELAGYLLTSNPLGQNLPGDWDFYRFHLDQAESLRIAVQAADGSSLDPVLSLLSAQGGHFQLLATNDDGADGSSMIQRQLAAGDYVIGIAGAQGSQGAYRLTVDDGIAPQVVSMSPDETVASSPAAITLAINEVSLDPTTLTKQAFQLQSLDASGNVVGDLSSHLGTPEYDPVADVVTIPLAHPLADGRYRLIASDSIRSSAGIPLDGDDQNGAGGVFISSFAVDSTPPTIVEGSLSLAGVAAVDSGAVRYRFTGMLTDAFPAQPGEQIIVQVDTGDGKFDGPATTVTLGDGPTPFSIDVPVPLPFSSGEKTVYFRLVDARGNTSQPVSKAIDTDLAMVTFAKLEPGANAIRVSFNRSDLANVDEPSSYEVPGHSFAVQPVAGDPTSVDLVFSDFPDADYELTILSGPSGIHSEAVGDLDGNDDGIPGGNFVTTIVVDRQPPQISSFQLDAQSAGSNPIYTSAVTPGLVVALSDQFPGRSEQVSIRLDVDGQGTFEDGQATATLNQSGSLEFVPISISRPLSEGQHQITAEVTDASGLTSTAQFTIVVDRTGPSIRGTQVSIPKDDNGLPTGQVQITVELNSNLDAAAAQNLQNYAMLVANDQNVFDYSGDDDYSDTISSAVYSPADPDLGLPPTVTITADLTDEPAGQYELIVRAAAIADPADNLLLGGDFRIPFQFDPNPPKIVSVTPVAVHPGQPSNVLIVQFSDTQLDASSVEQTGNFLLTRTSGTPATIDIQNIFYDPLTNRATITTAAPLAAGTYQLTVLAPDLDDGITGVVSLTGLALDGDGDGLPGGEADVDFNVDHPWSLSDVLSNDQSSLVQFVTQLAQDTAAQEKSFSSSAFVRALLERLEVDPAQYTSPEAMADAIDEQLIDLINAEALDVSLDSIGNQRDYLIVWARSARFLLTDPTGSQRIGYDANGLAIEEIDGGVVIRTTLDGQSMSLAIVPVTQSGRLASSSLTTVNGQPVLPELDYLLQVQGLAATNEAGVVLLHAGQATAFIQPLVNVPQTVQNQVLDLSQAGLDGFDPNTDLLTQKLEAQLEALYGPLDQIQGSLLFGWFDPVDYQLSETTGEAIGAQGGIAIQNVPGGFSTTNGAIGLIVVPGAIGGLTTLDLFGLGTGFHGNVGFATGGEVQLVPLEGALGFGDSMVALIDFRSFGTGGGIGGGGAGSGGGDIGGGGIGGGDIAGLPDVEPGAQTVYTASIKTSMLSGAGGLMPLFSSMLSPFGNEGPAGKGLTALASHVGRQGILARMQQLRLNVLRSLRSIRNGDKGEDVKDLINRLIAGFSAADPKNTDAFFQLESDLAGLANSYSGQTGGQQFELQLKIMRSLHDAITRMNQEETSKRQSPPRHGPSPPVTSEKPATSRNAPLTGAAPSAMATTRMISTAPRLQPLRLPATHRDAPLSSGPAAGAVLQHSAGERTHAKRP